MFRLIELVRFLRAEFPELNIFPIEYPVDAPDNSVLIDVRSNNSATAGVFSVNVQFKVRDTHPSKAEETSYMIKNFLEKKTDFHIDGVQVVLVQSVNPVPMYIGKDTTGLYIFSSNFKFTLNEVVIYE